MSLWSELKRRNVLRIAAAYLVVGWLVLQVADIVLGFVGAPDWVGKLLIALLVLGFPPVMAVAWIFEVTPEGVRRESELDGGYHNQVAARRLDYVTIGAIVALAFLSYYQVLVEPTIETDSHAEPAAATATGEISVPDTDLDEEAPPNSIAVLPFANISADAANEYFSDGISEEILNVLARIPDLRVAARTSAFEYKGTSRNVPEIARRLRVRHILEGSVRRQGDRIRVTAQLIQAQTGFHLWSETFDRTLDDVFAIQDEIAEAIAVALQVELGLVEGNRTGTDNLEAYEAYLRGVQHWYLRTFDDLVTAIGYFQQATEADPGFAKAHAGLAMTYAVIGGYGDFPGAPSELARTSAERALALDPRSAEATAALALSRVETDRDLPGAMALLREAITLNPNFATGHQWLGQLLVLSGQLEAAAASLDRAVALDPAARIMGLNRALLLYLRGRLEESLAESERVLAFAPDHSGLLMQAADAALALGDRDRHWYFMMRLGRLKGQAGVELVERIVTAYDDELLQELVIDELERIPIYAAQNPIHPSPFRGPDIPLLLMRMGAKENAVAYFRHLHRQGHQDLGYWLLYPDFAPLRCEPVIQSILEDLRVVPYWNTRDCPAAAR